MTKGLKFQGTESDKDEDEDYEDLKIPQPVKVPHMPEVSITVMRPTGETLQSRQGIQQIASKDCLICGRSYRYSHNARRHELNTHKFDRYTNRINKPKSHTRMQPKLRPNPFNPKARLMPNPISHKMQLVPKMSPKFMQQQSPHFHRKIITPPKPIPIKSAKSQQNNLPYPLRIKALKDLQIKKKEPQILKTLLTSKPEVLVSEPEIMNSGPESPETLISEPEIASFQVETILSEPNDYDDNQDEDEGDAEMHNHQSQNYDTLDMDSENEIEIARQQESVEDNEENANEDENVQQGDDNNFDEADKEDENDSNKASPEAVITQAATEDDSENMVIDENSETKEDEPNVEEEDDEGNDEADNDELDASQAERNEDDEEILGLTPQIELNEEMQNNSTINSEVNDEDEPDETGEFNDTVDGEAEDPNAPQGFVTTTQRDFIKRYRDIILQINTQRCLCCDKEYPRRKSVIQHLQKNGYKVPKHTCYNCVVTFTHIGALLSHMRHNNCTDLWKIIYDDNGITSEMIVEEPKSKIQTKDIFNAKSYACRLCPAKFQLKQSIMKHVSEFHEDGQSSVPMGCVHCGASFKDKTLLKKHIRNGECTVYIHCDLCSEQFTNMQEFNDHALSAHAEHFVKSENQSVDGRLTDCYLCGTKTSSYSHLLKHFKAEHDQISHPCQFCGVKFEQPVDLNKHMYMEHPGQTPDLNATHPDMSLVKEEAEEYHYSCTECNAIFETVDEWTDHQVAEHNQVAHHCDQCEKKFLRPSELAEHKNTHLRVKFYPCSICSNSYSTPQKLSDHVQNSHPGAGTNASPDHDFFCDMCIRPFKSRQAYSNHMRIHAKVPTTNRKPTQQSQAPKEFDPRIIGKPIKQISLSNVVPPSNVFNFRPNANVPNAPYSCDICGKGFMHKKNIWKHKKVLHADIINDRNDSEENTMHASTEEDDYNVDENGSLLSTPQFNSFAFPVEPTPSVHECELCGKQFPLKSSLIKHKRAKHGIVNTNHAIKTESQASPSEGTGRSSCTICKITFSDKKSYYRHRKNVHKSATQMCKICGKPLNSTQELYEHLKAAHASLLLGYDANQSTSKNQEDMDLEYDEPEIANPNIEYQARYPCDTCGKQFLGLLSLQNHQCVSQPPSQPQTFDCEICHKSYTSIAALKSHRGWHLRSPDGKAAANNSGLWMPQHKVTTKVSKHEVLEATPPVTGRSQSTASVAKRRLPPEVEVTVVNPNKKMRSDDSVEMEQHGDPNEGKYCTICDKEFTKRAAYQRHMDEVHQPNSVFCPVCDKSFTRKSTLLVHMKKHYEGGEGSSTAQVDEDDGFPCEICGAQYETENALRAHKIRNHADEESDDSEDDGEVPMAAQPGEFTCGQCGDGVATARDLITHRAIHSTHTKFFCNICKVYFARALDLSSHTRARHADNEKVFFPCAMCDRFYMNKKSLQRHIDMVH